MRDKQGRKKKKEKKKKEKKNYLNAEQMMV